MWELCVWFLFCSLVLFDPLDYIHLDADKRARCITLAAIPVSCDSVLWLFLKVTGGQFAVYDCGIS